MTRLSRAFYDENLEHTHLHWILDADDPALPDYRDAFSRKPYGFCSLWVVQPGIPGIVHPLNFVVSEMFGPEWLGMTADFIGFMGDDHLPRTKYWDNKLMNELNKLGSGIVYGNDLIQGERLPTAAFMTSDIVKELGFMAPPILRHLYVDDYWRDLGKETECLKYLPDIIIEHIHPIGQNKDKPAWDDTYERNNNSKSASLDRMAYSHYRRSGRLGEDADKIRRIL